MTGRRANPRAQSATADKSREKLDLAVKARDYATQITGMAALIDSLTKYYFDNGFDSAGGNAITDEDIVAAGITKAELSGYINFSQQFHNLLNNLAVTQGDWQTILNQVRNVNSS